MFSKKKPDAKEVAREAKRNVRRGERDIEKEIRALERNEKQLILDIKKTAKTGNERAVKTLASQLVSLRSQRDKLYQMKSGITSVGYQATSMVGQNTVIGAMGNVAGAMNKMNNSVDTAQLAKIMNEFSVQNEKMGLREDMMNDALIDAFDDSEAEEETNDVMEQILAEVGFKKTMGMEDAPKTALEVGSKSNEEVEQEKRREELMRQLDAL
mmetsp:Transcript_11998/g.17937  ORF Transcript_11998/g.17937 Transcript_11998/m.17937 type:complete len:212 (+) Transcript_11998:463-1098(+)|eukprot:CAMPEP_0171453082 /NCGR_PEP_ID=MMETSP0945-20130129/937_1 /TAXON_ID=109269 /ORGANISM="Vaucheria litorea, Strain CCMP2940" /LENGTH=211 /DNA_ID=CAMNT_0011977887 /DNA_START=460 /DNA_END=1095 /DNA_ORIENTATION=-